MQYDNGLSTYSASVHNRNQSHVAAALGKEDIMQDKVEGLIHYYFEDAPNYSAESVPFGLTNLTKIININERKYVI